MNTLHDMRELLLSLFNKSIEKYPLTADEENSILFETDDLTEEENNRYEFISNCVELLDEDEKENFIRLILIYFYTINYSYTLEDSDTGYEAEEDEDTDELMNLIQNGDEDFIINVVEEGREVSLIDLITFVIQEDIINVGELGKENIDDFDEYLHIEGIMEKGKDIRNIYDKLHPNIEAEEIRYNKYLKYENIEKKFINANVKSAFEFAQLYSIVKQNIKYETYMDSMLVGFLHNIKDNKDLSTNINIYMLKYSYLKSYLKHKDKKDIIKLDISKRLLEADKVDAQTINDFLDFDLYKYITQINLLTDEEKKELDDVVDINNLKNYGNDGIWKKYSKEQYNNLCKYSPLWIDRIDKYNEQYDIEIYYSIDFNGEYSIPRLCTFIKDNNFINVLGKRNGLNVELDLLDILEDKIHEYKYENIIMSDISTLKYIKYIENKINNNVDLTKEEFEYLYGIGKDNSYFIFGRYENKIDELRINPNEKKLFAKYYGCSESEVALNKNELNINTVVTKFFFPQTKTCYYPKLKVIFGHAYGDYLKTAIGLPSLEYIKYDASFGKLISSLGLNNLKYIGGNAFFAELEDTRFLSKDLVIKGNSFFKDGYEPSNKTLKK